MVEYEVECDPLSQACFVGCEDEDCTEEYYYSIVEKYADTVLKQCGLDITDCEQASVCLPDEQSTCSITLCNPDVGEECYTETSTVEDQPEVSTPLFDEALAESVNLEGL
jgi:hypothetical protein